MKYSIDHIAINVKSMEESNAFYGQGLGLEQGDLVDMGDHQLQYFKVGGQTLIELIQYEENHPHYTGGCMYSGVFRHMALAVNDISFFRKHIKAFINQYGLGAIKAELSDCPNLSFRNMLIMDPNGVEIEIVERY